MERRYQVFISSTFMDLRDERSEVIQALLELDCMLLDWIAIRGIPPGAPAATPVPLHDYSLARLIRW